MVNSIPLYSFSAPVSCLIFSEHSGVDHCSSEIRWSWQSLPNERPIWITIPNWCIPRFVWRSLLCYCTNGQVQDLNFISPSIEKYEQKHIYWDVLLLAMSLIEAKINCNYHPSFLHHVSCTCTFSAHSCLCFCSQSSLRSARMRETSLCNWSLHTNYSK